MDVKCNSKAAKLLAGKICFTRSETTVLTDNLSVLKSGVFLSSIAIC